MTSTIAAITTGGGGVVTTADASGNLSLLSGATTILAATATGVAVTGTLSASGATTLSTTLGVTGAITNSSTITSTGSVSAPNTFGFKNRIINGAMTTDQRNAGASQTFTAGAALAYSVDRWYGYCTGANVTGQQVAGATTPTNTQFRYRFTGAASVTAVGFAQRIEQKNSYDLAGSTCTLSADLAISATLTTVTWTAYYATTTADTFGSLASPTVTQIATGTFTVGATVTNFSTNISVPAAATTGLQILFTVGALTAGLTWTIGNVQLEKGTIATPFDWRPYGTELALCQRYYIRWTGSTNSGWPITYGFAISTTNCRVAIPLNIPMRSTPTASFARLNWNDGAAAFTITLGANLSSSTVVSTQFSTTSLTTFRGGALGSDGTSPAGYYDADSEL